MTKITIKPKLEMTKNMAQFLGMLRGNGYITKGYQSIGFANENKDIVNTFIELGSKIGLHLKIVGNYDNCYRVQSSSKIFTNWYNNLNIYKAFSTPQLNKAFLKGFYLCSGYVYKEKRLNYPYIAINDSNDELISFVNGLIKDLGIWTTVNKMKRSKSAFKAGFFNVIHIRRKGEAEKFLKLLGLKKCATSFYFRQHQSN